VAIRRGYLARLDRLPIPSPEGRLRPKAAIETYDGVTRDRLQHASLSNRCLAANWVNIRCPDRTRPAAAPRVTRSSGIASAPVVQAAATRSAQHFFDPRDPAGRGGIISGIPLALGHSDQTVRFRHAAFPSRHADLTAVDLVG
jgi:hypothetical protein